MTKDEALRLALEALKEITLEHGMTEKARTAIKASLEAKDEPVAWGYRDRNGEITDCITPHEHDRAEGDYRIPLYTTPPQRTWIGLTKEEFIYFSSCCHFEVVDEIEKILQRKNT